MIARPGLAFVCLSGALAVSCSDYFGDVADPGAYGPVEGGPRSSVTGSNNGVGGSSNNGSGGSNNGSGVSDNNPASNAIVVAAGINVWSLALDDAYVYAASDQGLVRVAKAGGTPMPIGILQQGNPTGIALDTTRVFYVTQNGAVEAVPKEGGSPQTIAAAGMGGGNGAIVLYGDTLYYTVGPYLRTVPVAGGPFNEIANQVQQGNNQPNRLAVDDKYVYFVSFSIGGGQQTNLSAVEKTGGTVQTLMAARGTIGAIAASNMGVAYTDVYAFGGTKLDLDGAFVGLAATTLGSIIFMGGNPDVGSSLAIGPSKNQAYFTGSPGLVRFDGTMKTIDSNANVRAIALDDTDVYYADQNGGGGPNPTGPGIKKVPR
jgi:hypothetical protein